MSTITLKAEAREGTRKRSTKALRAEGKLPAVIYGGKSDAQSITLDHKELFLTYQEGWFTSRVVNLDLDGKAVRAIAREIQIHPVSDQPVHVDFFRIEDGSTVRINVPVKFVGIEKSPGVKRGGVLNKVRRAIELICPADNIPSEIVADISSLKVKDSVHFSDLDIPAGCEPTITDRDFTIATVAGRLKKEEEEDLTAAPEAGDVEVIGEDASEEGEGGDAEEGAED